MEKVYGMILNGGEKSEEFLEEIQKMSIEEIQDSDMIVASVDLNTDVKGEIDPNSLDGD